MKRRRLVVALALAAAAPCSAEQALTRWTVDGGGGRSQNARYVLTGSVGQPDAVPLLLGTRYRIGGGFWADVQPRIFQDGFED